MNKLQNKRTEITQSEQREKQTKISLKKGVKYLWDYLKKDLTFMLSESQEDSRKQVELKKYLNNGQKFSKFGKDKPKDSSSCPKPKKGQVQRKNLGNRTIQMTEVFSPETTNTKRKWCNTFEVLNKKNCQLRILRIS